MISVIIIHHGQTRWFPGIGSGLTQHLAVLPGHVAGLSLLFIEVTHPSPTYQCPPDLLSLSLTCCNCVTQPVCAAWDDNADPCTQTSLSGSQNPTVCMSPNPNTGKKVCVDPLSHSASSGLLKRQGHGQRRELEAVLSAGSQPGTGI